MGFEKPQFSSEENYKKVFTESERAGHLSEEEAHNKANMMRADLGVKEGKVEKKTNYQYWGGTVDTVVEDIPTTKEDYEKAFQAIEDLEKLANEETPGEERIYKVKKILQLGGHTLQKIFFMLGLIPKNIIEEMVYSQPVDQERSIEEYQEIINSLKEKKDKLRDAKTKLKDLIKKGEDFGKEEKIEEIKNKLKNAA